MGFSGLKEEDPNAAKMLRLTSSLAAEFSVLIRDSCAESSFLCSLSWLPFIFQLSQGLSFVSNTLAPVTVLTPPFGVEEMIVFVFFKFKTAD